MPFDRLKPALLCALLALLLPAGASASQRIYFAGEGTGGPSVVGAAIGADGGLTPSAAPAAATGATGGVAISPDATSLYAASQAGLERFRLGPGGTIATTVGEPASGPLESVVVTPDGRFAFATETGGGGGVRAFHLGAGGVLEPLAGVGYPGAAGLAVSPDGRFLFATSSDSGGVRPYSIAGDGSLTPGAEVPAGSDPLATAVSPDGRHLYVGGPGAGSTIRVFAVGSDGALTQVGSTQPVASADDLLITPDGRYLYAADGDGVGRFPILTDGTLSGAIAEVSTAGSPVALAADAGGRRLYAQDADAAAALGFTLQGDAAPTPLQGSPFANLAAGSLGGSAAVAPDQPPVATFTTAVNNRRVSFDASRTTDPDGDAVRFDWDFGNGTTAVDAGPEVTERFGRRSRPPVTLTVADELGCSTAFVSAGHTAYCNGSGVATTTIKPFEPRYLGGPTQELSRTVRLRLRCPSDCRVKVVGRMKFSGKGLNAKKAQLTGAGKRLQAGKQGTLKLRLSKWGKEAAAEATSAVARLKVAVRDDRGDLFKERHGIRLR